MSGLDPSLVARLYQRANGARWNVAPARFAAALEASVARALGAPPHDAGELERYLGGLHLDDLALACACTDGHDGAWEYFVLQHRPVLYRAADALAPGGGAREIADALYADLFGIDEKDGGRRSLFRYFHGRSSLATWLRAVLSQRFVDRIRSERRLEPLPEVETDTRVGVASSADPDRSRYVALLRTALTVALNGLASRDRLRLSLYYARQLTLAQTGRVLKEHEATVSRHLARSRAEIKRSVEQQLRSAGLTDSEIARCFDSVMADAGPLDLAALFEQTAEACKPGEENRSI